MAAVGRGVDIVMGIGGAGLAGPGVGGMQGYWEAFVTQDGRFDFVLVGGERGRWATYDEAKTAAEAAYGPSAMASSGDFANSAAEDDAQTARYVADDDQDRMKTGLLAWLRLLLLPGWRWSDRKRRNRLRHRRLDGRTQSPSTT